MSLKIFELINIVLSAIVGGLYWGPWLALARSLKEFDPDVFLAIVNRLNKNMAPVMTALTPFALLSTIPVLVISYDNQSTTFYLTLIRFALFTIALLVTVFIEVPMSNKLYHGMFRRYQTIGNDFEIAGGSFMC
jgi:hypothetical protein